MIINDEQTRRPSEFFITTKVLQNLYEQIAKFYGEFVFPYRGTSLRISVQEDTSWVATGTDTPGSGQLHTFFHDMFNKDIDLGPPGQRVKLERVSPNSFKGGYGTSKVTGVCIAESITVNTHAHNDRFFILSLHKTLRTSGIWHGNCEFPDTGGWTSRHIPIFFEGNRYDLVYLDQENDICIFSSNNSIEPEIFATKCFLIIEFLHFLVGFDLTGEMTYGSCELRTGQIAQARRVRGRNIPERLTTLVESQLNSDIFSSCLEKCATEADGFFTFAEYIRLATNCPLEVRGAIFAIALEVLTDLHSRGKKADILLPIEVDAWAKMRPEVLGIFEKHRQQAAVESTSLEGWEILKRRLETANQPTNSDKLSRPFKDLGITLNKNAKKAIGYRNSLLHSGRIFKAGPREDDYVNKVLGIEANLFMLCAQLFLRRIGYSGPVIDWTVATKDTAPDPQRDVVMI